MPRFARNDGRRETGLLHFVRNDGFEVSRLPRFARNDGRRETGLLHIVRNDGRRGLDCFTLFAMTGGGGTGLPRFARNDGEEGTGLLRFARNDGRRGSGESKTLKKFEKNCFISLWEYT